MPIDKSWMQKSRVSSEYHKGVLEFLDFAFSNAPGKEMLPCPCIHCNNCLMQKQEIIWKSSDDHSTDEFTKSVKKKKIPAKMMRHPVDSLAWKNFDNVHPSFALEPRNVRLGLASDGFNPFGNMSISYNMWLVVLIPYNLPPWMCMKQTFFMLSLLIPGPTAPGNDIDIYLQPLIMS
ncbi:hypothetical protein CK203_082982 [Vitis vinifera]|uniref:Transposase-associated domain-containing protein n=1 Tax=Vitis vinifera TaxID=29760 RepID=A0A438DES5_VITVI|nr:hypothetical protein CK203_082982 [Vitis vinifera]